MLSPTSHVLVRLLPTSCDLVTGRSSSERAVTRQTCKTEHPALDVPPQVLIVSLGIKEISTD